MKIYANRNRVTFECDHCKLKLFIDSAKNKRAFMRELNKFARTHDHTCLFKMQRNDKIESSKKATDEILSKLAESCR